MCSNPDQAPTIFIDGEYTVIAETLWISGFVEVVSEEICFFVLTRQYRIGADPDISVAVFHECGYIAGVY
jgi:hypothetical protein